MLRPEIIKAIYEPGVPDSATPGYADLAEGRLAVEPNVKGEVVRQVPMPPAIVALRMSVRSTSTSSSPRCTARFAALARNPSARRSSATQELASGLRARVILAQGRQNTNYAINLYACHPFFIQGYASMTNGENTAFTPIREFLLSRNFPGYSGYQSDSEVFTHILHYTQARLGLDISAYKHIITPLQDVDIDNHPNADLLKQLKHSCRRLTIDGPNCVIGCLPDHSLFMVQDRKKLRPGVVGGGAPAVVFDRDRQAVVVAPDGNSKAR